MGVSANKTPEVEVERARIARLEGLLEKARTRLERAKQQSEAMSDDDDEVEPEQLGRRMYERGEMPSPTSSAFNDRVKTGYDEAAAAATATQQSLPAGSSIDHAAASGDGDNEAVGDDDDEVEPDYFEAVGGGTAKKKARLH